MNTVYPETMALPAVRPGAPVPRPDAPAVRVNAPVRMLDETIERYSEEWRMFHLPAALTFPTELEAAFEEETRQARVRELRFTVSAAIGFMCVTTVTDKPLLPDIGWTGLELRLVSSAVFAGVVFLFSRVSGAMREALLFWSSYVAVVIIIAVPSLSRAPMAPYGMFISFLAVIYVNTTSPMRFQDAWRFNLLALATIAAFMHADPTVSSGLAGALMFMGVVGASYTLLANYRMERSVRLGYLLASKEAQRLSALHRDRNALAALSNTDALTGIANRGMFDRRVAALFDGTVARGTEIHLIMVDVDFFKRYNDHYGHPAGDECLRSIALVLRRVVRGEDDFVFRYGGEEFGALLVAITKTQAEEIAERLRDAVEREAMEHCDREDGLRAVTVSMGMAGVVVGDGATAKTLIERADQCLYGAKRAGRNRISIWPPV